MGNASRAYGKGRDLAPWPSALARAALRMRANGRRRGFAPILSRLLAAGEGRSGRGRRPEAKSQGVGFFYSFHLGGGEAIAKPLIHHKNKSWHARCLCERRSA